MTNQKKSLIELQSSKHSHNVNQNIINKYNQTYYLQKKSSKNWRSKLYNNSTMNGDEILAPEMAATFDKPRYLTNFFSS